MESSLRSRCFYSPAALLISCSLQPQAEAPLWVTLSGSTDQPAAAPAPLEADDTAEKLGLEDEDLIDVAMEQTGGR